MMMAPTLTSILLPLEAKLVAAVAQEMLLFPDIVLMVCPARNESLEGGCFK